MRDVKKIEKYRVNHPLLGYGDDSEGICMVKLAGTPERPTIVSPFLLQTDGTASLGTRTLAIIFSCNEGWEHVSVSLPNRCPTWAEMCLVKDLFWEDDEAVMQLHPAKADYVNCHPWCLHLWRPLVGQIPLPPKELVGGA